MRTHIQRGEEAISKFVSGLANVDFAKSHSVQRFAGVLSLETEKLNPENILALAQTAAADIFGVLDNPLPVGSKGLREYLERCERALARFDTLLGFFGDTQSELSTGLDLKCETLSKTSVDDRLLKLEWQDGTVSSVNSFWLRDNCSCHLCGPHNSGARLQALLDIDPMIKPKEVRLEEKKICVVWDQDEHYSEYPIEWLRRRTDAVNSSGLRNSGKILWDKASLQQVPTVDYLKLDSEQERYKLFTSVDQIGFVLIQNVGTDPNEIERLGARLGYIRETNYARVYDLKMRAEAQILADLPKHILPHTDETYRLNLYPQC